MSKAKKVRELKLKARPSAWGHNQDEPKINEPADTHKY